MSARKTLLCLLLIPCVLLTGCWSRREIENLGFATLVAIDLADNGDIELTVQLAIIEALSEGSGGTDAPGWTVTTQAKSLSEAISKLQTFTGRVPFWAHTETIIIGEELATDGLHGVTDVLMRSRAFRLSTWLAVADGKAKDLLEVSPKITALPSDYVRSLFEISQETGVSRPVSLLDFLQALINAPGLQPSLPLLKIKPPEPEEGAQQGAPTDGESQDGGGMEGSGGGAPSEGGEEEAPEALILEGTAVFSGNKMVGKLDDIETRGLNWLTGQAVRSTIMIEHPDGGYITQGEIYARRVLRIYRDGNDVRAKISIFEDGDILEHNLPEQDLTPAVLKDLNKMLTAQIQKEAEDTLRKLQQELRVDLTGIGERVYRQYPEVFKSLNWKEYFPTMQIDIEVEANFRRTGAILRSPLTKSGQR